MKKEIIRVKEVLSNDSLKYTKRFIVNVLPIHLGGSFHLLNLTNYSIHPLKTKMALPTYFWAL